MTRDSEQRFEALTPLGFGVRVTRERWRLVRKGISIAWPHAVTRMSREIRFQRVSRRTRRPLPLRARGVVADAIVAIEDFEASPGTPYWRTRWIAVVAILRAVGHVLSNVDAPSNEHVRTAIDAEFAELKRTKPEPSIYWRFIDDERNRALKEMTLGARMSITVRSGASWYNLTTGETGGSDGEPTTYEHFMQGGTYNGKDPRDLCHEAVSFWNDYLDRVDRRAAIAADGLRPDTAR